MGFSYIQHVDGFVYLYDSRLVNARLFYCAVRLTVLECTRNLIYLIEFTCTLVQYQFGIQRDIASFVL